MKVKDLAEQLSKLTEEGLGEYSLILEAGGYYEDIRGIEWIDAPGAGTPGTVTLGGGA